MDSDRENVYKSVVYFPATRHDMAQADNRERVQDHDHRQRPVWSCNPDNKIQKFSEK